MKSSLRLGATGRLSTLVGPGQTITLGDDANATVFSTPSMIRLMEYAAREALRDHLDAGEESVGVDVDIAHSAATPPKTEVTAEARVTAIEKNVISFDVIANDAWGEIGRGTHRRAIIHTEKFAHRLAANKPIEKATEPGLAPPTSSQIQTVVTGASLHLTLNRPAKRNAMDTTTTSELERIVDWLRHPTSEIRVVIVTGAGDTFCAGDDVGDLPDELPAAKELSLRRGQLFEQITRLPQIFVATIDGLCLGGGLVLAASCDFRVATHRAKFGLPEVSLGWPPNYGMGILQSLIGRGRSMELALTGSQVDARRAESIGLVNRVVSPLQLGAEAEQIVANLQSLPAEALKATKQLLSLENDWSDETAGDAFVNCLSSERAKKSISRFR